MSDETLEDVTRRLAAQDDDDDPRRVRVRPVTFMNDVGPGIKIVQATLANTFFRYVVATTQQQQQVLMNITPQVGRIRKELHPYSSQYFHIVAGAGEAVIETARGKQRIKLEADVTFIVPANTLHTIINTSATEPLKLYTIYSPPVHAPDLAPQRTPN